MNWIETPTKLFISDLNKHEYHSDEYCHGLSYGLTKFFCTITNQDFGSNFLPIFKSKEYRQKGSQ